MIESSNHESSAKNNLRANQRFGRSRAAPYTVLELLDYYFVRKEKRGGAIVKLHQKHAPVQIIYLAQDAWLFIESAAPFVVAHGSLQLAMLSDWSFCV
jgi:hypothetical protein